MLQGLEIVIAMFCITLIVSIPLGIGVAFLRLSKNKLISGITQCYILIMRGTPLLLQMIVIFYGLPLIGIVFDRFTAGIVAFFLNYAAYFAEIFRGGIQSIDRGQYEASKVLGFDKFTMYKRIIFPQVFKRILAPISNEVITLVKDTSLVYILGLNDILRISQIAMNREASLLPLFEAGAIYLIFVAILTKGFELLEKKYSYYR
ncbi:MULTISPECIES: amino acid ABC transporter permease [Clostridioides]|uniref:amino acid ABC transporter permease n=1 Tax=unclassified Clostridioides TaxID=2635829 RepID=UPI001D0C751D|nr:amino acid ABC transporter permease [Clostridioides sp. ZZV15-6388]MCC0637485.1 amino acid ABC transporter permease [Clostridioides sp. ES-S-0001-02]MCC0639848.1 amino acid ABC transporter permease [Clostridioides sp. ES-S-0049-03]MCC0646404.1 amino acid ABC transporter permease [Clostridioides sp. ZZV14-6150]MCC0653595.1 amino acid ABC transporter permease [Clostridioides sp. ES-S-0001-03]MCC0655342.1 amino acid ABC transporter permease [Clostridioides sp. ES-S-0123-01]MCC0659050.1 amino 